MLAKVAGQFRRDGLGQTGGVMNPGDSFDAPKSHPIEVHAQAQPSRIVGVPTLRGGVFDKLTTVI